MKKKADTAGEDGFEAVDRPILLIIDMVKDNFDPARKLPITPLARRIVEPINGLAAQFRSRGWPVLFSTDAFRREDFIFTGRMHPHSIAGTRGAEIIDELDRQAGDVWLPKPRFSAFFDTGLADRLRGQGVTLCAVAGIATQFCVLTTALDALCNDFQAVILSDCTTSYSEALHDQALSLYRRNPLYPLLRVLSSTELLEALDQGRSR